MSATPPDRPAREARLLALVVVVALGALVLLARFRYPAANLPAVASNPGTLAGLAARATFDDMAAVLTNLLVRVGPSLVVVQLDAVPPPPAKGVTPPPLPPARHVTALRVRPDLAVLYAGPNTQAGPAAGQNIQVDVVSADTSRAVTIVRVRSTPDSINLANAPDSFGGFSYVAVIEATPGGPTIRPRFVGRLDSITVEPWTRPLMALGETTDVPVGSWIFAIDGRLIGLAVPYPGGTAIVPAAAIDALVTELTAVGGSS